MGYRRTSPDRDRPFNIIPSGKISMNQVDHPVIGIDNLGTAQLMMPGADYFYPGNTVVEFPFYSAPRPRNKYQVGGTTFKKQVQEKLDGTDEVYVANQNTDETNQLLYFTDLANYLIASGRDPAKTKQGKILWSSDAKLPGSSADARKLYYSVMLFNQRNDVKGASPEERLERYYNGILGADKDIEAFKSQVKTIGYGVVPAFRNSPDVDIQNLNQQPSLVHQDAVNSKKSNGFQQGGFIDETGFIGANNVNPFFANPFFETQYQQPSLNQLSPTKIPYSGPAALYKNIQSPGIPSGLTSLSGSNKSQPGKSNNKSVSTSNIPMAQGIINSLALAGNLLEQRDSSKRLNQKRLSWSDFSAPVINGNRGDYSVNEGFMRPDRYVPVQFGAMPSLSKGGYFDLLPYSQGIPDLMDFEPSGPPASEKRYDNSEKDQIPVSSRGSVRERARAAFDYYTSEKGLSKHIAAGIIGNLFQESGLKTNAVEKGNTGNGRGIAQWDVRNRWQGLLTWAKENGRDPMDMKTQLDYILVEPGEGKKVISKLSTTKTPEDAAEIFGKIYERPHEKFARWETRKGVARKLFDGQFKQGGEYSVTPQQLLAILQTGGEVEFVK